MNHGIKTQRKKKEMEHIGAAYMAEGIITLAGSRLYTSAAYTEKDIDDVLSRFEKVFQKVIKLENKVKLERKRWQCVMMLKRIKSGRIYSKYQKYCVPLQNQIGAERPEQAPRLTSMNFRDCIK